MNAKVKKGTGGATKAFLYKEGHRIKQIKLYTGYEPFPGSLNLVVTEGTFNWNKNFFSGDIDDVLQRPFLYGLWAPRKCRFYALTVNGQQGHAIRFYGEKYGLDFVEVIAPVKLRDALNLKTDDIVEVLQ